MTTKERRMVRGHLLAAGFRRSAAWDAPNHYDNGRGVYTEVWRSVADRTTIELNWDAKTQDESKELAFAKLSPDLHALIDHLKEYANAVSNDLEQGVHWLNNVASEEFAKKHPSQLKWADKMGQLIEKLEQSYDVYV